MPDDDLRATAVGPGVAVSEPPLPASGLVPADLPRELTSFIGREYEIAEVARRLRRARLLTLTGTGGVGKTRLALQVAERLRADFRDSARFVDLAPTSDAASVAQALVGSLGLRQERDRSPLDTLLYRLQIRQVLLILDNCEHLLAGCAQVADALLRVCPDMQILATSREPLGVTGEMVWAVPALKLPDRRQLPSVEVILASEGCRLFVERAATAQSTFTLQPENAPAVAEICWQLEGIPLAIELAAVRVRSLTVDQIATRLGDRLRLLSSGPRAGPRRHQTLRATVDWSYDLLSYAERVLFQRLSVFAGGWTIEAVELVCSGKGLEPEEIVGLLARLVDRGLVQAEEQSGAMRYRLFETLRQYAAERLAVSDEDEAARLRDCHRAWCVALAEEGERDIWRADQVQCVARLEREQDNVRAALGWTLSGQTDPEPGLRIAAAMVRFWDVHGNLGEGMRWLSDLLALRDVRKATPAWARALTARAYLTILSGDGALAMRLLDETLPFWRALADPRGLAIALFFRGVAVAWTGTDLREAVPTIEESLTLAQQRGPRWTVYFCLYCLGEAARLDGDLPRADSLLSESLALSTAAHDRWGALYALYGLAFLALLRGDQQVATDRALNSLRFCVELGDTRSGTYALEALGCIAAAQGRVGRAARLFGAAAALREPVGDFISASLQVARGNALATIRAELGPRGYTAASTAGQRLSFDQAVALARDAGAETAPGGLTAREREVTRLVAGGLSNQEIAEALVLTERTAESHLTHIFGKLGLRSRTQLARWALEHGLLAEGSTGVFRTDVTD